MLEPSKFVKGIESVPNDILVKPRVIVVGLPKSGKSDLCRILNQKIGVVHLQFEDIIEDYITRESSFCNKISELMKSKGREIDDLF
jgi:adenylate kinase family enzyme